MNNTKHVPVLIREVMELLNVKPGKNYVDATLGGGGYTEELLKRSAPDGIVIAIDENNDAIEHARGRFGSRSHTNEKRKPSLRSRSEPLSSGGDLSSIKVDSETLYLVKGNFRNIVEHLHSFNVTSVSGVVFDLGLSSDLLEGSGRGFSFKRDEPLLMSFSSAPSKTAAMVLNNYSALELAEVLRDYGEVLQAEKIARAIYERRKRVAFKTTGELSEAVDSVLGKHNPKVLAQVFQALRIEVNDELEALGEGLEGAWEILESGGIVAVVSYHSLEDRIVKHFFSNKKKGGEGTVITKKPLLSSAEERKVNPRAASAKLRIAQKI